MEFDDIVARPTSGSTSGFPWSVRDWRKAFKPGLVLAELVTKGRRILAGSKRKSSMRAKTAFPP